MNLNMCDTHSKIYYKYQAGFRHIMKILEIFYLYLDLPIEFIEVNEEYTYGF